MLRWLWLLPCLAALLLYAAYRRRLALSQFADPAMRERLLAGFSPGKRLLRQSLFLLALLFLLLALARPAWNLKTQTLKRHGRDVVFLLDVSRSMLAEDLKPNRLERAKLAIDDCVEVLSGDRVALVLFAGTSVLSCPLTRDYGFFRMRLAEASPRSVARGGTLIGDALRKVAREVFDRQERQYKDIVLITDGEDHESFPLDAAKAIGEEGIRLIALGLGNESGSPIVISDAQGRRDLLRYNGEIVRSGLDSKTLRQMVEATPGGRYLPVGTGNIELDKVYTQLIASAAKREMESQNLQRYEEKFQIFLLFGMLCLVLSSMLSERRQIVKSASLLLALTLTATGAEADRLLREGNKAMRAADYGTALEKYAQAAEIEPDSPYLYFNRGMANYKQENFTRAAELFSRAYDLALQRQPADRQLASRAKLALGNCAFLNTTELAENKELDQAVQECERSVAHYQDSLQMVPKGKTAKANAQKAKMTLKKLLHELQQQEEQQQQQQQGGEKQEQGEEEEQSEQQGQQQQQQQRDGEKQEQAGRQEEQEQGNEEQEEQHSSSGEDLDEQEQQQDPDDEAADEKEQQRFELNLEPQDIIDEELQNRRLRLKKQLDLKPVDKDW